MCKGTPCLNVARRGNGTHSLTVICLGLGLIGFLLYKIHMDRRRSVWMALWVPFGYSAGEYLQYQIQSPRSPPGAPEVTSAVSVSTRIGPRQVAGPAGPARSAGGS